MKSAKLLSAGLIALVMLWGGVVLGQDKARCDQQGKLLAPEKVEGQVVKIDTANGRLSVREGDGKIHEFQASQETLQDLKVGDQIQAKLRAGQKC